MAKMMLGWPAEVKTALALTLDNPALTECADQSDPRSPWSTRCRCSCVTSPR
jgi:hypothetical protein